MVIGFIKKLFIFNKENKFIIIKMDDLSFINLCENMCPTIKGQINNKILQQLKKSIKKYFKIIDNPLDLYNIKPGDKYLFSKFCLKFYKKEDILTQKILKSQFIGYNFYNNIYNTCRTKIYTKYFIEQLEKMKYLLTISHYIEGKEEIDAFMIAYPKNKNNLYISLSCARTYDNINPSFGLLLRCILLKYAYENGYKNIYNEAVAIELVKYYSNWGFRVYSPTENCDKDKLSKIHSSYLEKGDEEDILNFYNNYTKNYFNLGKTVRMRICQSNLKNSIQKIYDYTSQKLISIWDKLNNIDTGMTLYLKYVKYISENYDIDQIKNINFNLLTREESKRILSMLRFKYGIINVRNELPDEFKYLR